MKKTRIAALLLGMLGTTATGPAFALADFGTYSFLRDTPAEAFTDEDWKIFKEALNGALNDAKDGETRGWENPATGASGEFTILKTVVKTDADCREVRMTNKAGNRTRTTGQVFCVGNDGIWKIGPVRKKSR
jgi:surface antigen